MADDSNVLDQLISRVGDETLRTRLAHEVELLRGSRRFGLVFDRHLPESVRLPDHPIRKGIRVALRDESSTQTWIVDKFANRTRDVAILTGDGGSRHVSELIVVREFGEPIYPGLRSVERIQNGSDSAPWHIVINGENFHALQTLRSTHRSKVDLIYIDPPYNTGNDGWIYNDRYVDQNDRAKSSKWLSFMERRLQIAWDLLKPTGVIVAAIGDEEHHRLQMLLDQVFGSENFISKVVWQGGRKNDSRYVSNGADYMIIYARDEATLSANGVRWRELRPGSETVLKAGARCWEESHHDPDIATAALRKWFSSLSKDHPAKRDGNYNYNRIDSSGRVFYANDLRSPSPRPNLQYDLIHPITGDVTMRDPNGWAYSRESMDRLIEEDLIWFDDDNTRLPRLKKYLDEQSYQVGLSVFEKDRRASSRYLQSILGDKRFPFPKDHEVLARWIGMAAPKDAVVLDFFGGSGTTTEAVMRLNADDEGTRQSILVTNNEVGATEARRLRKSGLHPGDPAWEERGVFDYVCRIRVSTVVTGQRPDGSAFSSGLAANVEMFDLTYLDPGMVRRGQEFQSVAPLMWLEAGARGPCVDEVPGTGWALTQAYGVLFEIDELTAFTTAVTEATASGSPPAVLFVITDSETEYQQAVERLPSGIATVQLYEDYLSNYTINIAGDVR